MKIALLGYGKMGKVIEEIALNRSHEIVLKINNQNQDQLTIENLEQIDVAIDFSTPNSAKSNILIAIKSNTPIISGTTGWLEGYDEVSKLCIDKKSAFLYASNFSLGANLFFELNKTLAILMKNHKQYDVNITEIHHTQKLDTPSGTAISLAEQIISENDYQNGWTLDKDNSDQGIIIDAQRDKMTPGTHIINYKSEVDTISIKHEAHSRKGFALGAVIAAEWIQNKKGVFSMRDVLFRS
jgi:4-hydroxy-tetrahydrodipicolinate reductase